MSEGRVLGDELPVGAGLVLSDRVAGISLRVLRDELAEKGLPLK